VLPKRKKKKISVLLLRKNFKMTEKEQITINTNETYISTTIGDHLE
jgi:hypothetical protein